MAPSPEAPTQCPEDGARHEGEAEEADHVVPVRHVAAADGAGGEIVTEKPDDEENRADPHPMAGGCGAHARWPFPSSSLCCGDQGLAGNGRPPGPPPPPRAGGI